ncbi:MAG: 4-hydroxythreonine-4-phosphate dehydrogenase PdxA [Myxococcales bacterium]|nr:4-hydroxythreonine-4-phosphate dehydrogenase PdxA [Myxococcales bacterium]
MSAGNRRPLAVTTGDPGGVGPEVALRACLSLEDPDAASVLYGDAGALRALALELGLDAARLQQVQAGAEARVAAGRVGLVDVDVDVDVGVGWSEQAMSHRPTAAGGRAQLAALDAGLEAALAGRVRALVTAPMSKAAVVMAGTAFSGHTEHLARAAGLADDEVTMSFLGPRLKVALATTHMAVAQLSSAITQDRVLRSIRHLAQALLALHSGEASSHPLRLLVTGLNPHAGEGGLFGSEEPAAIAPAVELASKEAPFCDGRMTLEGPLPAETAFRLAAAGQAAGVVAMMHDQATIASKLLDWTAASNVTLGLPFVRTSVDHGVAYDAAAAGTADAAGMAAALRMALRLTPS